MIRATYRFGRIGDLSDVYTESYWVPGLWGAAQVWILSRASLEFAECESVRGESDRRKFQAPQPHGPGPAGEPIAKASMRTARVGFRLGATTPQGVTVTLNYLYQRTAHDDGVNTSALRGLNQCQLGTVGCETIADVARSNAALLGRGILPG